VSLRALIALAAALAAAVALLIVLDKRKKDARDEPAASPLVPAFEEASVTGLRSACGEHAWAIVRAGAEAWRLEAPVAAEADPRRVHDLIAAVQGARIRKVIEERGFDENAFSLAPGCRLDVTLSGTEGTRTLRLGRTSPVGVERYAVAEGGRLVLTDAALHGLLDRDGGALRERRLLPFDAGAVTRIALERPGDRLVLAVSNGAWSLLEPVADRASAAAGSRLAAALASLELDETGEAAAPASTRRDRRVAIEVTLAAGTPPLAAYVASAGLEGRRVAWRRDGSLVGLVAESALNDLELVADAYRDKRVLSLSLPDVRSVLVERGGMRLRVHRAAEGDPWKGEDGGKAFPVDGERVAALLNRVRELTAVGFASDAKTPATGTLVVGGASSELARLTWGPLPPEPGVEDESLWVTTTARPGVRFRVDATALGPVPAKSSEWTSAP
jgi:hypothetical protein